MANEHLKNALQAAGLTVEQFADIINVDPKTVQRWTAGRTPYPRHRATIARALDIPEHELWPDDVPPPATPDPEPPPSATGDVTGSWGRTSHPTAPHPATLLAVAVEPIELLEDGHTFAQAPGVLDALRDRARDGCPVRVLALQPTEQLHALIGLEDIELRTINAGSGFAFLRAGDAMLLTLALGPGAPAMLQLHRHTDEGVFDRLTHLFQNFWDQAQPITDPRQLTPTSNNADRHTDQGAQPRPTATQTGHEASQPTLVTRDSAPRRWPGRTT